MNEIWFIKYYHPPTRVGRVCDLLQGVVQDYKKLYKIPYKMSV